MLGLCSAHTSHQVEFHRYIRGEAGQEREVPRPWLTGRPWGRSRGPPSLAGRLRNGLTVTSGHPCHLQTLPLLPPPLSRTVTATQESVW